MCSHAVPGTWAGNRWLRLQVRADDLGSLVLRSSPGLSSGRTICYSGPLLIQELVDRGSTDCRPLSALPGGEKGAGSSLLADIPREGYWEHLPHPPLRGALRL